jgi:hypothetical protein
LHDIHAGVYGSHVGANSLMGKMNHQGLFWLTAV